MDALIKLLQTPMGTILAFAGLVIVFFAFFYRGEQQAAEREKLAAKQFVEAIASARNTPESERAREMAKLVADKHALEKALEKCESDAGPR